MPVAAGGSSYTALWKGGTFNEQACLSTAAIGLLNSAQLWAQGCGRCYRCCISSSSSCSHSSFGSFFLICVQAVCCAHCTKLSKKPMDFLSLSLLHFGSAWKLSLSVLNNSWNLSSGSNISRSAGFTSSVCHINGSVSSSSAYILVLGSVNSLVANSASSGKQAQGGLPIFDADAGLRQRQRHCRYKLWIWIAATICAVSAAAAAVAAAAVVEASS